ncbi:MAG: hypothetical protein DRP29_01625 [Thermodesulfobacteriota bacterium]|nr:MAG: hypothetical protein DRP29_01625 [Thermodesulfobacteriota bacterium]
MFEKQLEEVESLLEEFEEKVKGKYNINHIYHQITLKQAIELLRENIEILQNLQGSEISSLAWYSNVNFDVNYQHYLAQNRASLSTIILEILNQIKTNLSNIISGSINNSFPTNFTALVIKLHTILKDFRFDLDIKKLPHVRAKLNEAKRLLEKANEIVEKLKEKRKELEKLNEEVEVIKQNKEKIEELYDKVENIHEELNNIREKTNKLNAEYEDAFAKKSEIDKFYENLQEIKERIENLKEEFSKKIGEYETKIRQFEEEQKQTLEEFKNETGKRFNKLQAYEEKQKKILESLIERAQNALEWTNASGMKTAFADRTKSLKREAIIYFILFLITAGSALIFSYFIIFCPKVLLNFLPIENPQKLSVNNGAWYLILARIGIIVPLLFFVFSMWKTFYKTRILLEEYHKKEILAQNLVIGANTLRKEFEFDEETVKKAYIKPTIDKILEDPVEKVYQLTFSNKEKNNTASAKEENSQVKNKAEEVSEKKEEEESE